MSLSSGTRLGPYEILSPIGAARPSVPWGILYEFLRVSTHPRVFAKPWTIQDAWGFVAAVLASPGLRVLIRDRAPS